MQCEGWRRYGGMFTFGPVRWKQCKNEAIVKLTAEQDGETKTFPACIECWTEALESGIRITEAKPVVSGTEKQD